jgi:hypothetical protein
MPAAFREFRGDYRNPVAVCQWIEENVPCTVGPIPEEYTSAVFDEARRRLISHETVSIALTIARKDGYNFAGMLWSPSGRPVYVPTQSKVLENALMALDGTALAFSERFIRDGRVRANYVEQAKAASRELQAYVSMGEMSAEEAALKVNELRNAVLEASRLNSSDLGRAFAVVEKATGLTIDKLQAKYAAKLFNKEFSVLSAAERDTVLMEIVRAAGRPNPKFTGLASKLGKAGKGLLIVSFAFAAYNVATSDRPGREAVKQTASIGAGILGGAAAGMACGPGAPVCVAVGALVGGIVVALGTEQLFDWLWK